MCYSLSAMQNNSPTWPQGVSLKPALRQATEAMNKANGPVIASKAACDYQPGVISVPFFSKRYLVSLPEARVGEEGSPAAPAADIQLLILHYLLNAEGTPPAGIWVTYRHVPDGMLFEPRFNAMAVEPLVRAFKSDLEGFSRACESIGGLRMTRTGDASYRFMAFPQIPMGCVLYLADEEMAASVSILFDAVAPNYLCAEDTAFLGIHLSELLLKGV